MRVAFVGCGFVFDIYMRTRWAYPEMEICGVYDVDSGRLNVVSEFYGLRVYPSYEFLLQDARVEVVINLTHIDAHYRVSLQALEAGKSVYSEKPIATDLAQAAHLFAVAKDRGIVMSAAPCNLFSDSIATLWKAVRDGSVGKPVLVYAELDDNPAHLMGLETVKSSSGAPWPLIEEYQQGCTFEHVGYHLVWLCAIFGPVRSVTAFSECLILHKTSTPLLPANTPDFSVACLSFAEGVVARVTCSVVAPRDHRLRVIGEEGEIVVDSYRHYQSPVHLERFSRTSLDARKLYSIRTQPTIGRLFGVGGRRLRLVKHWKSYAVSSGGGRRALRQRLLDFVRRKEVYAQDKLLGVAEMTRAMRDGSPQLTPPDFLLHVNELTLLIQRAGSNGLATTPTTTFQPLRWRRAHKDCPDYLIGHRPALLERLLEHLRQRRS